MNIYALSDLHLSFGTDKPMNVFGRHWDHYEDKMRENWNKVVCDDDYVLICGDISWATYIEESLEDFRYIEGLNGNKIISKGNHDYWWTTAAKQKEFLELHNIDKISFLHNNSYELPNGIAICGARGWLPIAMQKNEEDRKIYDRELIRLEISLQSAPSDATQIIAMLHYPPDLAVMEILSRYNVGICVYGHLHGGAQKNAIYGTLDGIRYELTSCDYLGFRPMKII